MSYQIDVACDIITMALTIRLGKGGITDARTSQFLFIISHALFNCQERGVLYLYNSSANLFIFLSLWLTPLLVRGVLRLSANCWIE